MKALLIVNGWKKITDIQEECRHKGYIDVTWIPPFPVCVNTKPPKGSDKTYVYTLYYSGCTADGLPIFSFGDID